MLDPCLLSTVADIVVPYRLGVPGIKTGLVPSSIIMEDSCGFCMSLDLWDRLKKFVGSLPLCDICAMSDGQLK